MPELLEHIERGDLKPEVIISHHLPLSEAVRGYELFAKKKDNYRKVVPTPDGPTTTATA